MGLQVLLYHEVHCSLAKSKANFIAHQWTMQYHCAKTVSHWSLVIFYNLGQVFGNLSSSVSFRNLSMLQIHRLLPHIFIQQNSPIMGTFNMQQNRCKYISHHTVNNVIRLSQTGCMSLSGEIVVGWVYVSMKASFLWIQSLYFQEKPRKKQRKAVLVNLCCSWSSTQWQKRNDLGLFCTDKNQWRWWNRK